MDGDGKMMLAIDNNKLVGESNYHVWRLKMSSMLKLFDLWIVTTNKIKIVECSPVMLNGILVNKIQLTKLKNTAHMTITISLSDSLVDLVFENDDPPDVCQALERNFQLGDQGQILIFFQQLNSLKMMEVVSITQYTRKQGK